MTANKLSWKVTWTCNNADTIKMAVAEGLGVSVISKRAIETDIESGLICTTAIKGIRFERTFKIAFHKNKYMTEQMNKFIDLSFRQE